MPRTLSQHRGGGFSPRRAGRGMLPAVVLLAVSALGPPAAGAAPPAPDAESAPTPARLRAYLPALLQKALLENQREHVATVRAVRKTYQIYLEGGLSSPLAAAEVEEELLQARTGVLQQEADYQDALDRLKLRSAEAPARLKAVERSTMLPLVRHLRGFEEINDAFQAAREKLSETADPEKVPKLRGVVRWCFTDSPLVKGTTFRKDVPAKWAAWEKRKHLDEFIGQYQKERRRLLERQSEFEGKRKPYPQADRQRLEEAELQVDLGTFEQSLRQYERQPWKGLKDDRVRQDARASQFILVGKGAAQLLERARQERLAAARRTWPAFPPTRLGRVDLLTCDPEQAERAVNSLLKEPAARAAARQRLRKVRTLAAVSHLQRRVFEVSLRRAGYLLDALHGPTPPPGPSPLAGPAPPGSGGDVLGAEAAQQLLRAQRSLTRAKGQLLRSWVGYQLARLDLYRDLGLTPP